MPSKFVLASAGSGKTQLIIDTALGDSSRRTLITTYTRNNTQEIVSRIHGRLGFIPPHITVRPWMDFLINQCARPLLPLVTNRRIVRIDWESQPPQRTRRENVDRYFFADESTLLGQKASDLACLIDDRTDGAVVERLEGIWGRIFIDEMQDLSGYDLELLKKLLGSRIEMMAAGDPRQQTYLTDRSRKNSQHRGMKMIEWVENLTSTAIEIQRLEINHRSTQEICDFADSLYPDLSVSMSSNTSDVDHSGIFLVSEEDVPAYYSTFSPAILRYDRRRPTYGLPAMNFGEAKGLGFDRVLVLPTKPILRFLETGDPAGVGSLAKFYVAVTRARYSLAFAIPKGEFSSLVGKKWAPRA